MIENTPKKALAVFNEISLDWKVQIFDCIAQDLGHPPSSYINFNDADTLLPEGAPEQFAAELVIEVGTLQDAYVIAKASIEEHMKLVSSYAINKQMNNPEFNKIMEHVMRTEQDNASTIEALGELGYQPDLGSMISNTPSVSTDAIKPGPTLVPRKHKVKKKGAKRQTRLDNIKGHGVKAAMGANILRKLGAIQQKTTDHTKQQLLKELPLADLVEAATGEKIPDYQANLLNGMQAKADPEAPVVQRQRDLVVDDLKAEATKLNELVDKLESNLAEKRLTVEVGYAGRMLKYIHADGTTTAVNFERLIESVADEMGTTIQFVEDAINNDAYLPGLRGVLVDDVDIDGLIATQLEAGTDTPEGYSLEQVRHMFLERLAFGYTHGYVKGIADSTVKLAQQSAVEPGVVAFDDDESTYEEHLDNALELYISPEFMPEGTTVEAIAEARRNVRELFLSARVEPSKVSIERAIKAFRH